MLCISSLNNKGQFQCITERSLMPHGVCAKLQSPKPEATFTVAFTEQIMVLWSWKLIKMMANDMTELREHLLKLQNDKARNSGGAHECPPPRPQCIV